MKTYKIRPYHGNDCDSVSGFNNGYYCDDIIVIASDEYQAQLRAMAYWRRHVGNYKVLKELKAHNNDFRHDGYCFYIETGFYDDSGNEITQDEYCELTENDEFAASYRYEFVDFCQDIKEITTNKGL